MSDPIYYTDDYPREGCRIAIDVQADSYVMAVFAPDGRPLETYGPKSARQLARMIEEWCSGAKPRGHAPLDQISCGSLATSKT